MKIIQQEETIGTKEEIYKQITSIKSELHELVQTFGIVHELTVAKSQELDLVVNQYMGCKN
ncbi:MAG: Spo0E family sporulation regulatory protein-aspartic acid phosphatase [Turicibacter sp.]